MATDLSASFNEQYMNINTKLKKRFLRKPNIAETTNEFNALAIQCEHSEQPSFAGHAYIGAAKCEASAGHFLGEAEYYLAAARQFMKAEMKLSSMKSFSLIRENLEASIGCFMQALSKYPEKSPLSISILMELANDLVVLNKKQEALHYYEQALESIDSDNMVKVKCMTNLIGLNIELGRNDIALKLANEVCDSKINIPEYTLTELQITRVLLALLAESSEEKKSASLQKLFSDLINDCEDLPFNTDLRLKLQSIVISRQAGDLEPLVEVSTECGRWLTLQQQGLLTDVIRPMERGS